MKEMKVLFFFALLFSIISCKKDEISTPGYADKIVGTYNGTLHQGSIPLPCTIQINKTTETKVTLMLIFNGSSFTFGEINVTKGGNNIYNLSYSDPSGYVDGKVDGNSLTISISGNVWNDIFTGNR